MAIDLSELEKFRDKIKDLEKELPEFERGCADEIAARLLRAVRQKTPVGIYSEDSGKMGGTLRRNWNVSNPKRVTGGFTVDVINNTEYASYVEYGHRQDVGRYVPALGKRLKSPWVDGRHMLTDSVDEIQGKADDIVDRRLKRWLEGKMNGK